MNWLKRYKIPGIIILAVLVSMGCTIWFYCTHPTYYKYNDSWILGKTVDQVRVRYGEFDVVTDGCVAYYIYTDNSGFLPDHLKHYYFMEYDNNDIIYEVHDSCQLGG